VLPTALERVRRKLAGSDDGDRQMVKILAAVLSDGLPEVEGAPSRTSWGAFAKVEQYAVADADADAVKASAMAVAARMRFMVVSKKARERKSARLEPRQVAPHARTGLERVKPGRVE
jgi:hypothetical protein